MKYPQFDEISGTPNNIVSISYMRNIGYCDGKWWWAESAGADNQIDLKIYSATSLTATPTLEHTESYTDTEHGSSFTFIQIREVMLRTVDNYIMAIINFDIDDGSEKNLYASTYSTDSGSSWNTGTTGIGGNANFIDLMVINSDPFMFYNWVDSGTTSFLFVKFNANEGTDANLDGVNEIYAGYSNSDKSLYYFVYHKYGGGWYIASYNGTNAHAAQTDIEQISFTEPSNWNSQKQLYWNKNNTKILIDQDYIRVKYGNNDWLNTLASTTPTQLVIIYGQDQDSLEYILWDGYLWKLLDKGNFVKIQEYTRNLTTGYINWFSNGINTVYQITYEELTKLRNLLFFPKLYTPSYAELICEIEPFDEQYVELYTDDEELIIADYIVEYETDRNEYRWLIGPHPDALVKTGAQYTDLNEKVTASFTDKTLHYILKYIIDNFCTFLWYDAGIDTTPSDTYTISFKDKTVLQCMKWIDQQQGYQTSIRPNHEVYWDEYTQADWDYKKGVKGVVNWGTAANPDLTVGTDTSDSDCSVSIVESVDGHKNVMQLYDNSSSGDCEFTIDFPAQTSGTISFWVRGDDISKGFDFYLLAPNYAAGPQFGVNAGSSYFNYYDSGWTSTGVAASDNKWYHFMIVFNCSTDTYQWYIGGILAGTYNFANSLDSIGKLRLSTFISSSNYKIYIDAIGFSWDGYTARSLKWVPFLDTDCTATVDSVGGRDRVIDLYDNNSSGNALLAASITEQSVGTVIAHLRTTDANKYNTLYIYDGSITNSITILIGDAKIRYYDTAYHEITTASNNTWYKCKFIFDCADNWSVEINETTYGPFSFRGTPTAIDEIRLTTLNSHSNYHFYADIVYISGMRDLLGYNEYQLSDHVGPLYAPPTQKIQKIKYGRFIVHGGYVNGRRLKSESIIEPNFSTFIEEEPSITDQTALDDYRQSLENTKNTVIKKYKINLGSRFPLLPGEQIWMWLFTPYSVYKEVGYVVESKYEGFQKMSEIIISDQIWQPPLEEIDQKSNNNEILIAETEAKNEANYRGVYTFTADDTTPSVSSGSIFYTGNNTGSTTITQLEDGKTGQRITLIGNASGTAAVINNGGNFKLTANWTANPYDTLELIYDGTYWIEITRSNN